MDHKRQPTENRDSQSDFLRPPIKAKKSRWGSRGITVKEWLELLIVPVVLALITVVFTWQQNAQQQKLETQRAEADRELADLRAQDEALQVYLDQMSDLLLEKNLRKSKGGSEVRTLARARTLTVLGRLDEAHKRSVAQFLVEAFLIQDKSCTVLPCKPVISLEGADLEGVYFGGTALETAL